MFQASERQEVSEKHTKPNMQVQKQTFMNDLIFHMQAEMLYGHAANHDAAEPNGRAGLAVSQSHAAIQQPRV